MAGGFCNVLSLDGGGVRGLSSLVILRALMSLVNEAILKKRGVENEHVKVNPEDVFDFVSGTSTGGLIAIILGRLGMTVEGCIEAYQTLARHVFGTRHIRGRLTHGLSSSIYSGRRLANCINGLLRQHDFSESMPMVSSDETTACAVVCREHSSGSRFADYKEDPVAICSHRCPSQVPCLVIEAARATSAAPTFFSMQRIGERCFSDGGMQYNNPTFFILNHCLEANLDSSTDRINGLGDFLLHPTGQGDPTRFQKVRFVNLGTGTKPKGEVVPQNRFAGFVPSFVRMVTFLKGSLKDIAVNPEGVVSQMKVLSMSAREGSPLQIEYERLSADTGVASIKLGDYMQLGSIVRLTEEYLAKDEVRDRLKRLAESLAEDYVLKRGIEVVGRLAAS